MPKHAGGALLGILDLNRAARLPLFRQLDNQIRQAILSGRLPLGTRLPSSRVLARDVGVSRLTVVNAFQQLIAEGFLEARRGAGSFVASGLPESLPLIPADPGDGAQTPGRHGPRLSRRGKSLAAGADRPTPGTSPFAPNQPAYEEFPFSKWSRLWSRCWRQPAMDMLNYGDPLGYGPLRREIALYLADARGVRCEASQVIIVSGAQKAIGLAAMILLDPGDSVWMEDPGYVTMRELMRAYGARVVAVPVDRDGLDVKSGIAMAPAARMAVVTPSRQYPLGVLMSLPRRLELLEWAQTNRAWIIEDDYDSEFRFAGRPLASMQSLDRAGRVIYIGTFSKVLFPSLRIGYLVVPADLVDATSMACQVIDKAAPTIPQVVLAEFMAEGHFATHIRRMRSIYRERHDVLIDASQRYLAGLLNVRATDSGMNVIGWLSNGIDDREAQGRARADGIVTNRMSYYYADAPPRSGLHLGFCNTPPAEMSRYVQKLAEGLESLTVRD
ncbi:MAG: PLP-dependent aminotransferase family protein [Gammaproteobacteria bacterium]|nr:MAG: PLP-dependent aminotransferase family protein [Gammaproteobacteria bacterium]